MTRRRPVVGLLSGAGLTGMLSLVAAPGHVPSWERWLFEAANGVALPLAAVWVVMQLGNVLAVPGATVLALVLRRRRVAAELAVAGIAAYLLARVLKAVVDRGRPAELLLDVHLRAGEDAGSGFPSGHAAVAVALAGAALPHLGPRARAAAVTAAALVCLARVHVGAHLPLDVVGGAAVGVACAAAVHLLRRSSAPRPADGQVSPPPQREDGEHAGGGGRRGRADGRERGPRAAPPHRP